MASSLIGALRVALGLDTAEFEAGANKATNIARQKAGQMEASFKSAKTAVEGLFAAFTVGLLAEQIKKSLEYAGSLAEVAKTLGVTTTQLQTFRFAATQSGVAQDQLEVGLRRLGVSMGKAELNSKAQVEAFKAIGISVDQLKGKNTGDVFKMISDSLSKVTDRSQRAAVEMILMGRSGSTLDNLLAPGSKRLNELAEAAQRLGIVLSDQQIQGAEETAHKLEAVKQVLAAQIAGVVADNASAILSLSSALATLTGEIAKFLGSNPQLALSIIGALLGGRVGGLPGAVLGGGVGALLGGRIAQSNADSNMDIGFRRQQVINARNALNAARSSGGTAGMPAMSVGGIQVAGGGGVSHDKAVLDAVHELNRQTGLLNQAAALAKQSTATPPGVDLPKFLAGKGPKPRKQPADRSDEVLAGLDKEILQATQSILQEKQQLAGSAEEHLQISVQQIELDRTIKDKAIDEEVAKDKRQVIQSKLGAQETALVMSEIDAKARTLKAANDEEAAVKMRALVERELAQHEHDLVALAVQQIKFREDALHTADALATTQEDHRKIQLAILDAEIEQQRLQLEANKRDAIRNGLKQEQIDAIQHEIDQLPTTRAEQAAVIKNNTLSPLDAWAKSVPKTAADINESLQSIEVQGLDGLTDAIDKVVMGTESMKQAFHELAASVLEDLLKMTIKMLLFKALEAAIGGGTGVPSPDLGSSADVSVYQGSLVPSSANWGFAEGGFVSGNGTPTSDSIPAMLSNGEYVMSASSVKKFGVGFLDAINSGRLPRKSGGGILGGLKFISPVAALQSQGLLRYLSPIGIALDQFGVKGFASGGFVTGLPIPRFSAGGMAVPMMAGGAPPPITINADFRGADPAAVGAISQKLEELKNAVPIIAVQAWSDANQRFVFGRPK